MPRIPTMHSARLRLRPWRDDDLPALAALCADAQVMRHFSAPLNAAESATLLERLQAHFAAHGFGFWVLERRDDGRFVGFTGLGHTRFDAPFTPAVELAWRLCPQYWGQGLASEAARAALADGFGRLGLAEVVAFTTHQNLPSIRLMQALGMQHDAAGEFAHPALPPGHPLRPHVLYRLPRPQLEPPPARP